MTIVFQAVHVRSQRRLRLTFSEALGSGAFATSWFSMESRDDLGAAPGVCAALVVPSATHEVELALNLDLVGGGSYKLSVAAGVPAAGGSTAPAAEAAFYSPLPPQDPSDQVSVSRVQDLVFQSDLVHDGIDFVEGVDGDLATISGPSNAKQAVARRAISNGLPWDPSYSPRLREFVDAPSAALPAARGRIVQDLVRDDRVRSVDLNVDAIDVAIGTVVLPLDVVLVDGSHDILDPRLSNA